MTAFFLLLALVGASAALLLGGGIELVIVSVIASAGLTFMSYFSSDTIALRANRAQPADRTEFSRLHNLVEEVSLAAGIPKPRVYIVHDPSPNAFATGRNEENAAVAVTTGLLDKMNRAELEGVVAHELAHIRNRDILVMTVAVATAGSIAMIADIFWRFLFWGSVTGGGASHRRRSNDNQGGMHPIVIVGMLAVVVLAPLAAMALRSAVSRSRESLADATAVKFTRYPSGLRQALEKLDADITVVSRTSHATSHLWIEAPDDTETNQMGQKLNSLFSTHPPLAERINLLREMEGMPPYEGPDPVVAESLRTFQDDRVAAMGATATAMGAQPTQTSTPAPSSANADASAASSVDLHAIFDGVGDVAPHAEDPSLPVAGWYADPEGQPGMLRYWSGTEWTSHRHEIPDHNRMAPPGSRRRTRRTKRQ